MGGGKRRVAPVWEVVKGGDTFCEGGEMGGSTCRGGGKRKGRAPVGKAMEGRGPSFGYYLNNKRLTSVCLCVCSL